MSDQQHCSRLSQKACGQMPNLRSVIQEAPMSMTPATMPVHTPTRSTHTHPDQASWAPYDGHRIVLFSLHFPLCKVRSERNHQQHKMLLKSILLTFVFFFIFFLGLNPLDPRSTVATTWKSLRQWSSTKSRRINLTYCLGTPKEINQKRVVEE